MDHTAEQDAPRRGRPPREESETLTRRRRSGVLDVMAHDRLNPFDAGMLDPDYTYRWQTDEGGALRALTVRDDWDYVSASELPGFDLSQTDSEGGDRIRLIMNGAQAGPNAIYGYLLKKRRDFWEQDRRDVSDFYEQMMDGRVYEAQADGDPTGREAPVENAYTPRGNQLGTINGSRRRGPVPRSLK